MSDDLLDKFEDVMGRLEAMATLVLYQTFDHLKGLSKEDRRAAMKDLNLEILEFALKEALKREDYEVCEMAKELIEIKQKEV